MKRFFRHIVVAATFFGLCVPVAEAFDPYIGKYEARCRGNDFLNNNKKGKPRVLPCNTVDANATAAIENTGGPFDAKVTVNCNSGRKKKTYVITLNADGTGTCTVNGVVVAGKQSTAPAGGAAPASGVAPGSTVKLKTTADGTWTLGEGVRTTLSFQGKTNGIPTTITGFMDLTDEGDYILKLKTSYKKGNNLFAKPSVVQFGP